jgi:hypothetical protein
MFNDGWSDELKQAAVKGQMLGQLWGHDALFELKSIRGHQHLWH